MAIQRRLSDTRVNRAIDERDDKSGSKKPGVIDYKALGAIPFFTPKADESYKLNIIPYVAKNPLNPMVSSGQIAIGDLDLWLEVWAHREVGTDRAYVLCPNKMWGKRCPLCDKKQKLYDVGEDDKAQKFQPSKRILMYVQTFVKGEPQPIQLFEVSHYAFGAPLLSKADRLRKEGKIENFGDPDRGNLLKFYAEKGQKKGWVDYEDFEFLKREEDILDEDLDNPSIDEFMIVHTAEEIQALMDETSGGDDDDGDDGDDRRSRSESRRGRGRDRDDDEKDPPRRERSSRGRDDDRPAREERPSREERSEFRRERPAREETPAREERPARERQPREEKPEAKAETNPAPSDSPVRQRPREESSDKPEIKPDDRCPHNHGWGPEAVDKFSHCADCSKWSDCLDGK